MYYEPDTVWGRTIEGDEEVTTPSSGLSLVQRRVLRELGRPRTFAALAARHRLEAPKLEHELIWLAERRLVAFQRPGIAAAAHRAAHQPAGRVAPRPRPSRGSRRCPSTCWPLAVGFGSVLLS